MVDGGGTRQEMSRDTTFLGMGRWGWGNEGGVGEDRLAQQSSVDCMSPECIGGVLVPHINPFTPELKFI